MEFYKLSDIQTKMGLSKSTLYKWLEDGLDFPFAVIKIGRQYRFPKNDFDEWFEETYTLAEIQKSLGIAMSTLYKWLEGGKELPFAVYRFGKQYRVPKAQFDKWKTGK